MYCGLRLEDFQIGKELGKGGFGVVYEATHPTLKKVALKKLPSGRIPSHRIQSEIDLLKNITHNNIVKCYGDFKSDGFHYIVLELCEHGSIRSYVKKHGALTEAAAAYVLKQIVCGVMHCHKTKIMHRDLSAGNILISSLTKGDVFPLVKIGDFGLARLCNTTVTQMRTIAGTPGFMAPEVAGGAAYNEKADIYSMGATLFTMLTGDDPPATGKPSLAKLSNLAADLVSRMMADDNNNRIELNAILNCEFMLSALPSSATSRTSVDRQRSMSIERRGDADHRYSSCGRDHSRPHPHDRVSYNSHAQLSYNDRGDSYHRARSLSQPPAPREPMPLQRVISRGRGESGFASGGSEQPAPYQRLQTCSDSGNTGYARFASTTTSGARQQFPQWPMRLERMDGKTFARENMGKISVANNALTFTHEDETGRVMGVMEAYIKSGQVVHFFPPSCPAYKDLNREKPVATYTSLNTMSPDHQVIYKRAFSLLMGLRSQVDKIALKRPKEFPWAVAKIMENGDFRVLAMNGESEKLVMRFAQGTFKRYPPNKVGSGITITDEDTLKRMKSVYGMMCEMEVLVEKHGQSFPFIMNAGSMGSPTAGNLPSRIHSAAPQLGATGARRASSQTRQPSAMTIASAPPTVFAAAARQAQPLAPAPLPQRRPLHEVQMRRPGPSGAIGGHQKKPDVEFGVDGMKVGENKNILTVKHRDGRHLRESTLVPSKFIYRTKEFDQTTEIRFEKYNVAEYPTEALDLIHKLKQAIRDREQQQQRLTH